MFKIEATNGKDKQTIVNVPTLTEAIDLADSLEGYDYLITCDSTSEVAARREIKGDCQDRFISYSCIIGDDDTNEFSGGCGESKGVDPSADFEYYGNMAEELANFLFELAEELRE